MIALQTTLLIKWISTLNATYMALAWLGWTDIVVFKRGDWTDELEFKGNVTY